MHGVDWVLSDSKGHLFIECKTKRLTLDAKTLSDSVALDRDLDVMAKAVVQHYRNRSGSVYLNRFSGLISGVPAVIVKMMDPRSGTA